MVYSDSPIALVHVFGVTCGHGFRNQHRVTADARFTWSPITAPASQWYPPAFRVCSNVMQEFIEVGEAIEPVEVFVERVCIVAAKRVRERVSRQSGPLSPDIMKQCVHIAGPFAPETDDAVGHRYLPRRLGSGTIRMPGVRHRGSVCNASGIVARRLSINSSRLASVSLSSSTHSS